MDLHHKVAIITGASRGIGKAIAEAFAKEGADLVIVARGGTELDQVAETIREMGRDCLCVPADVTKESDIKQVVSETLERFGKIDILVNNAGIGLEKSIQETDLNEWNRVLNVNLTGTFLFTREVLESMAQRGQGQIINIASDMGKRAAPRHAAYCVSKYGVRAFSAVLAKEVRKLGIKVGVINPGNTDTTFNDTTQGDVAKKGWLHAEDIACAAVYMAGLPRRTLVDEIDIHPIIQEY